ncbi:MAG TPA: hypothetical protein VKB71_11895 [Rhizomicrobium sp.]|nr:hypothetical protein [Rhizomicrobium sp.]
MKNLIGALAWGLLPWCLFALPVRADTVGTVGAWTIEKFEQPHTCDAAVPVSDNVQLAIAVLGPQLKLIFSSPDFHLSPATYPVAISIDGSKNVTVNALGEGGVYAVAIVRGLGMPLRSASTLAVTIGNKTYTFDVRQADAAMDAASKCAGMPPYVETFAHPPQAIAGAGEWKLVDDLPGVDHCSLRRNGEQVDTMLMRNKDGRLVLFAGRADWAFPTIREKVSVQFDDLPAREMDASVFDNLIIVLLDDPSMEQTLLHAKHLHWQTPQGDLRADLDGVSQALDELHACDLKKAAASH